MPDRVAFITFSFSPHALWTFVKASGRSSSTEQETDRQVSELSRPGLLRRMAIDALFASLERIHDSRQGGGIPTRGWAALVERIRARPRAGIRRAGRKDQGTRLAVSRGRATSTARTPLHFEAGRIRL